MVKIKLDAGAFVSAVGTNDGGNSISLWATQGGVDVQYLLTAANALQLARLLIEAAERVVRAATPTQEG